MFVLKQFLKQLLLPPLPWLVALLLAAVFWPRRWARNLLWVTVCGVIVLHSGFIAYWLRYPLEASYPPLLNPTDAEPYDAIVVLSSAAFPKGGLAPFPTIDEHMFRRLDEACRLYKIRPKPIIVSGGHVDPFTADRDENKIARDYLLRWGVPEHHVLGEAKSRDTFESAVAIAGLLKTKGWKRYLLVTSALHMPRSMLAFSSQAPEPIPAPGDFTVRQREFSPFDLAPTVHAARLFTITLHEYVGLVNYYWRTHMIKISDVGALEPPGGLHRDAVSA
jgi:uncharacterized SAM-binding protein YcdF (DUF218 family)